jgi:hypothetical protein
LLLCRLTKLILFVAFDFRNLLFVENIVHYIMTWH